MLFYHIVQFVTLQQKQKTALMLWISISDTFALLLTVISSSNIHTIGVN